MGVRRQERKTPAVAGASGRASLRAGERRHSPFIRQRRQKAMPARRCGKLQPTVAREGFLDRRSKRCFWLLLSPQTKVARAGARNYPRWRQIMCLRRCGGDTSSAPFGGTFPSRGRLTGVCPPGEGLTLRRDEGRGTPHPSASLTPVSLRVGRFAGLTRHRRVIQHRDPSRGKAWRLRAGVQRKFTVFLQNLKVELRKASML